MALAERRWSAVTVSSVAPKTSAAVAWWMSLSLAKALQQAFVLREVRHDAQLDLRIVRRQQHVALGRDECLTDAPPLGRAYRDVLQVGILRRQPAGGGHRLVIAGVHAPGTRVDLLG